jgi:hypothetical protein
MVETMTQIRLTRTFLLPALLLVAALLAFAFSRSDDLRNAVESGALSTGASVALGLAVAALLLFRVSARR